MTKLCPIVLALALAGCDRLLAFGVFGPRVDAAADAGTLDAAVPDLPSPPQPYSLLGLPEECGLPLFAIWEPPKPTRVLYVSSVRGQADNVRLDPPCPQASPCRQLAPLFERLVDAPDDHTMCDASAGKLYLKYLQPGDLVLVEDGEYAPFEIRQVCGTAGSPIVIRIAGAGVRANVRGAIPPPENVGDKWTSTVLVRLSRHVILDGLKLFPADNRRTLSLLYDTNVVMRNLEVNAAAATTETTPLVTTFLSDSIVEGCEVHHGNWAAIEVGPGVSRVVFARNRLHHQAGGGFQGDPGSGGTSAITEFKDGPTSECNLFDANTIFATGSPAFNLTAPQRSVIRNNLLYNVRGGVGLSPNSLAAGVAAADLHILNNTVDAVGLAAIQLSPLNGKVYLHNNILQSRSLEPVIAFVSAVDVTNATSSHNALGVVSTRRPGQTPLVVVDETGESFTLDQWKAKGMDAGSIEASIDSLVVDASTTNSTNYRLKATSAARNAGVFIPEKLGKTIEGNERNPAAVDLGCY